MADKLSAEPDKLRASATTVHGHGHDVNHSHTSAHSRVTSAADGWKGESAQALSTLAATMKSRAASTVEGIHAHSSHLHGAADKHDENEQQRAKGMTELG
jgi:WXG100 family type VII secretion target